MKTITCKRCRETKPRFSSRNSKVWGGRICKVCSKFMWSVTRRRDQTLPPSNIQYRGIDHTPAILRKTGMLRKIARLFTRRGVQ